DWLIEHIYPHAVLEVAARAEQPQRIRVGKTYLKDGAGRVVPRRPWQDTPAAEARRWFRQAIRGVADELVLGQSRAAVRRERVARDADVAEHPERHAKYILTGMPFPR